MQGLPHVTGITIIQDTGIFSDHYMIISKCDFGIEKFEIFKDKEERIDFHCIMNISMVVKQGHDHPSLNNDVYKGA
jgi:hypothetical protein